MRAISKNTRKATAITLAAALVIAVYLNWQYARTGVTLEEDAVNVSAVSQETVPVTDELMTEADDEAMDSIQKALKSASLSTEEKKEYTSQLTGNLADLNAENEIETLVKAKGFADCLCFLQSGRADLTVMTSGDALTAAQVAQIRDIVLSKSSVTAQNITVVEVK